MEQEEKLRTKEDFLKEGIKWLFNKYEACSNRYIEDEKFLLEYMAMPFWKKWLLGDRIMLNHINKITEKYKF